MQDQGAAIAEDEFQRFVRDIGQAIQNFGAIEFLINHFFGSLVKDRVLRRNLFEQPISKRLNVLEKLLLVNISQGDVPTDEIKRIFADARLVFRDRNKIAHNPFVVMQTPLISGPKFQAGIRVTRHHDHGTEDEWIDLTTLQECIRRAHSVHERLGALFDKVRPS
jgi:hypothetical protein